MGKGEIAHDEQFLLFPQCFQKTCIANTLKPGLVWERVKAPSHLRIFLTSPYGCHISVKVHGLLRSGHFYVLLTSNWCPFNPFPNSPGFYVSAVQAFWKHFGKRRNCLYRAISPFLTLFSHRLEKITDIFIKFEIVVCKHFYQIWNCRLQTLTVWESLKVVIWERV